MGRAHLELIGTLIDRRYRVDRCVGSGGMGTVWRAQHVQSLQHFALKTFHASGDLPEDSLRRCLKEARAAASLRSRNVVRITDVQPDYVHYGTPLPYLVMELLEGGDLESVLLRLGTLSPSQVVWVLLMAARGLQLAHDQGIVHRDLKPANLFVTRDDDGEPTIKICDFGLAKIAPEISSFSEESSARRSVVGTPRYMAPEQLRATCKVTPALDQWALALIAFRLLTDREYFDGPLTAFELSLRIAQDELPAPSRLSNAVPAQFDAWFFRSCSRDPAARFESVSAQTRALVAQLGPPNPFALDERVIQPQAPLGDWARPSESRPPTIGPAPPQAGVARAARTLLLGAAGCSILTSAAAALWIASLSRVAEEPTRYSAQPPTLATSAPRSLTSHEQKAVFEIVGPPVTTSQSATTRPLRKTRGRRSAASPLEVSERDPRAALARASDVQPPSAPSLEPGAECSRSIQCASHLCVAERCR